MYNYIMLNLIFSLITQISLGYNILYDYQLNYQGIQSNNSLEFKFANNNSNCLFNTTDLDECKYICNNLDECKGLYYYVENNTATCKGLYNLGNGVSSNLYSESYRKVSFHKYSDYNTINGKISGYKTPNKEFSVYIDINHNGKYDNTEPLEYIDENGTFTFSNILPGNYIVKQIIPKDCHQFYPALTGIDEYQLNTFGDGYADIVLEYHNSNLGPHITPYGGNVNNNNNNKKLDNFKNILGKDWRTFISLPKNSYIILGFTDESVINTDGDDIYIREVGHGGESGAVYVSNNLVDYIFLGNITCSNINSYDLDTINFNLPVHSIRMWIYP